MLTSAQCGVPQTSTRKSGIVILASCLGLTVDLSDSELFVSDLVLLCMQDVNNAKAIINVILFILVFLWILVCCIRLGGLTGGGCALFHKLYLEAAELVSKSRGSCRSAVFGPAEPVVLVGIDSVIDII